MNKGRYYLIVAIGILIAQPKLFAQSQSSDNGAADATLCVPIHLQHIWPLSFGNLVPSPTAGTATIGAAMADGSFTNNHVAENPTTDAHVTALVNQEGSTDPGPATFWVTGDKNLYYSITLPNEVTVYITTFDVVAPPMQVDNFVCNIGSTGQLKYGLGQQYFAVGGTLHVGANQPAAYYTGEFPVTVAYN